MRINKFLAAHTDLSRRAADKAISNGRVVINGQPAKAGDSVDQSSTVTLDGQSVKLLDSESIVLCLNKPVGYVCSHNGQGAPTVYDLLPEEYQNLNIAGRLDKDSSGLVVLTNDGELLNTLTHPSNSKQKIYHITVSGELAPEELRDLTGGVDIGDARLSRFKSITPDGNKSYRVVLEEGRNRQIRRSFEAIGYEVKHLHRSQLGQFKLGLLNPKEYLVTRTNN